ncbi:hypothetical protein H6P81_018021 [Aristolochia fimbriata]|uniref:glutamate--tRNA ligase n=1 Tax=Aristolochia fimbriata TaxID=158543 RepID=A0AAV7E442_ARIFI|nr:hypothetical protein H6P81_018021 [Aristolochia fimbriata]
MEATILFATESPPLAVLAAAKIVGVSLLVDGGRPSGSSPILRFNSGLKLHWTNVLMRYIARAATIPNFYGQELVESAQIDELLDYAPILLSDSEFENACHHVDDYLSLRTFLVGNNFTIADVTIWSNLAGSQRSIRINSIASEYSEILNDLTSVYVGKRGLGNPISTKPKSGEVSNQTSKPRDVAIVNVESTEKEKSVGTIDLDLPGAKVGEVCLRFAPEPSGYLHIGPSKAAVLNKYFAEKYHGKLILRFDDTNPSKESTKFVDNLLKDIETLGIKYDVVTRTSDYFPQLMEMAENLIRKGKAYVDDTPWEQMQKERMDGIESNCRKNTVEQNLELRKEMIRGSERGLQCCLRGKLDMQAPNKSLRDPVYYRCNPVPHHRIGSNYNVYPTYDSACPFVDAIEGVSHALRSSEYHDRNEQYYRILEDMELRKVQIYEFSRLNMVYTLLSKRKLLSFVQEGKVDGWDDPQFPTVQGIIRRGLKIEALIEFIVQQRASKNQNLMEWDKLWTINKKIIDPVCPRHTAVIEERRVQLVLRDGPEVPFVRIIPRHKKHDAAGTKATTYTNKIWIDYVDVASIYILW